MYGQIEKQYTNATKYKSNMLNIVKDVLYVQKSQAPFIKLRPLIKKYWNELSVNPVMRYHWLKPQGFDNCCILTKKNEIINCK